MSSKAIKIAQWSSLFERYQKSSTSVTEFCHQERVTVAAFYYWRTRVPNSVWRNSRSSLVPISQSPVEDTGTRLEQVNGPLGGAAVVRFTLRCGDTTIQCESSSLESIELLLKWASSSSRAAQSNVFQQLL